MSAPLTASASTVGKMLAGSVFEVPAYQREYAWKRASVEEFWRDLSGSLSGGRYFLGLIILAQTGARKQIVDGQQRLLTITLLAAALRRRAMEVGRKALAERIYTSVLRAIDYATDDAIARITLLDATTDRCLQEIIEEGRLPLSLTPATDSSIENLWNTYTYFMEQLKPVDRDRDFSILGSWAEFINERLYIAAFEHPDESTAYTVFEVVNTRGMQLTPADLIKNYVLRETASEHRNSVYERWTAMVRRFETVGIRNFVPYIRHVVNLDAGYVLPKDLYDYISRRGEYAGVPRIPALKLMDAFEREIGAYLQLVDPTLDGPFDSDALGIFAAFNELGVTAVRPLMLAMKDTNDSRAGMVEALRLVVRKTVTGNLGAGSVERKFAEAAKIISRSGEWARGLAILRDLDASKDDFVDTLSRRSYNRGILTFLRRSLVLKTITPYSIGTLQYLRPRQTAEDSWPQFSDDDAAFWFSTLGNTVLTTLDRRPRLASTWAGVQDHLLEFAIEDEIVDRLRDTPEWTPESVAGIGLELAKAVADVWY